MPWADHPNKALRIFLVWGSDVNPDDAEEFRVEEVVAPRPVALFWIGCPDESKRLRSAFGPTSAIYRLDRQRRALADCMADQIDQAAQGALPE